MASMIADIDGFKLLEIIGLEMDIPVISAYPCRDTQSCRATTDGRSGVH